MNTDDWAALAVLYAIGFLFWGVTWGIAYDKARERRRRYGNSSTIRHTARNFALTPVWFIPTIIYAVAALIALGVALKEDVK